MTTAISTPVLEPLAVDARTAAQAIGVSPRTLWSLTAPRGPIPAARIGCRVLYRIDDLRAYLARLAAQSCQQPAGE